MTYAQQLTRINKRYQREMKFAQSVRRGCPLFAAERICQARAHRRDALAGLFGARAYR